MAVTLFLCMTVTQVVCKTVTLVLCMAVIQVVWMTITLIECMTITLFECIAVTLVMYSTWQYPWLCACMIVTMVVCIMIITKIKYSSLILWNSSCNSSHGSLMLVGSSISLVSQTSLSHWGWLRSGPRKCDGKFIISSKLDVSFRALKFILDSSSVCLHHGSQ